MRTSYELVCWFSTNSIPNCTISFFCSIPILTGTNSIRIFDKHLIEIWFGFDLLTGCRVQQEDIHWCEKVWKNPVWNLVPSKHIFVDGGLLPELRIVKSHRKHAENKHVVCQYLPQHFRPTHLLNIRILQKKNASFVSFLRKHDLFGSLQSVCLFFSLPSSNNHLHLIYSNQIYSM